MANRSPLSSINRETGIRDVASDAQYLSSNCVVYIYYSDLGSVIEEHFSKALNSQQQPNFSDSKSKGMFWSGFFKGEKIEEKEREEEERERERRNEERKKFDCFAFQVTSFERNVSLSFSFSSLFPTLFSSFYFLYFFFLNFFFVNFAPRQRTFNVAFMICQSLSHHSFNSLSLSLYFLSLSLSTFSALLLVV